MKHQKWVRRFAATMAGLLALIMLASLILPYLTL